MLGVSHLLSACLVCAAAPAAEPSSGVVIDGLLLHGTRSGQLIALRLDDGREAWRAKLGTEPVHPVNVVAGVLLAREDLGAVIGFDLKSKAILWRTTPTVPELPTAPFPTTRTKYWAHARDGRIVAHDPRTGRAVQQSELLPSAVMIGTGGDHLLAAGLDRLVLVGEDGRRIWSKPLPERRVSAVSQHGGVLTLVTEAKAKGRAAPRRTVRAFTSSTGASLWSWPADLDVDRALACDGVVVVSGRGKAQKKKAPPPIIVGLDSKNGRALWRRSIGADEEVSCPSGHAVVEHRDSTAGHYSLKVIDPKSGLPRWERICERARVASSRLRLYLASASSRILAGDAADGAQRWMGDPDVIITPVKADVERHRQYISCGVTLSKAKVGEAFPPLRLSAEARGREVSVSRWLVEEKSGSGLPPGMSLSREGTLFGRPRRSGIYSFRLTLVGPELSGVSPGVEIRVEP